jgi:hypothetical protein
MNDEGEDIARLTELAIDRLVGTLSEDDAVEYAALRARLPGFSDADLERAVAVTHLASGVRPEPLPQGLQVHLAGDATDYFASASRARGSAEPVPHSRQSWRHLGGWFAAAACLVVALVIWEERPVRVILVPATATSPSVAPGMVRSAAESAAPGGADTRVVGDKPSVAAATRGAPDSEAVTPGVPAGESVTPSERGSDRSSAIASERPPERPPERPSVVESAAAQRERLLASNPYVLRRPWRAGNDAAGFTVSGDVVWDPRSQTGFMRFVGLRRNEPNAEQYQLWIFDARRDDRYPVDGGVFDISGAKQGDVIPIRAALRVGVALTFAVTIEKPGGVVVSDRSRIAALADTT